MRFTSLKCAWLVPLLVTAACGDRLLDIEHPDILARGPAGAQP